jgi:hypothetical protein
MGAISRLPLMEVNKGGGFAGSTAARIFCYLARSALSGIICPFGLPNDGAARAGDDAKREAELTFPGNE